MYLATVYNGGNLGQDSFAQFDLMQIKWAWSKKINSFNKWVISI